MIAGTDGLCTLFAGGIGRERIVGDSILAIGHGRVRAIETGLGSKDELADLVFAGQVQQIERAVDIGIDIDPRVLHRVTHASPGSQVNDGRESFPHRIVLTEQLPQSRAVADVHPVKGERRRLRTGLQLGQPPCLEANVIGIIDAINAHHVVTLLQKKPGDLRSDKPRDAGYQIGCHRTSPLRA